MVYKKQLKLTSHHNGHGGGTECPINLFDKIDSKFCAPKHGFYFKMEFDQQVKVNGFSLKSANDFPERDPMLFSIIMESDYGKIEFKYKNEKTFAKRHDWWNYMFDNVYTIKSLKF